MLKLKDRRKLRNRRKILVVKKVGERRRIIEDEDGLYFEERRFNEQRPHVLPDDYEFSGIERCLISSGIIVHTIENFVYDTRQVRGNEND